MLVGTSRYFEVPLGISRYSRYIAVLLVLKVLLSTLRQCPARVDIGSLRS